MEWAVEVEDMTVSLYDKTRIMGRRYEGTHRFLSGHRRP